MGAAPKVFTIPSGENFARVLATGVLRQTGRDPLALADVTLLVPTRRAARTLQEEFARAQEGAALGPRIRALGDLDADETLLTSGEDELDLPPAIAPLRRRLLLATLIERWALARGTPLPFAQAVSHAGELGRFLDEVTTQGADLAKLKDLAPAAFAAHWQDVMGFLRILSEQWPPVLAAEGAIEPAARRDAMLRRYAARLAAAPPSAPIIAAGSTGSIPATAELLKTIAYLPTGAVVLPGLDTDLDSPSWDALEEGHAQFGLRQLLQHIGATRDEVTPWSEARVNGARANFLSEALRPPPTTDAWRAVLERGLPAEALRNFALVEAANPRQEALVIALALREALETPQRRAALVTPDRGLARRVSAELKRWDIGIDDSAGTPLARTPPGAFLALLARAAAERFAPVPLLALLKHPLAAGGRERAAFRRQVRALEIAVLHGLRPAPGLAGIDMALAKKEQEGRKPPPWLRDWFARLAEMLAPFAALMEPETAPLPELVRGHAETAEALAATDDESGLKNLWRGDAGKSAATLIAELIAQGSGITLTPAKNYADLFRDLAEARSVRLAFGGHPRLAILGPLEARLQQFDLVILAGLNEGTWPAEAATDPWLSRPMREAIGLEAPERRIGLAAHDFSSLAAGADVLMTRALKQDGAPANASRWLLRIRQLAKGLKQDSALDSRANLLVWGGGIDRAALIARAPRPEPRPPLPARPRRLSVTSVERWLRDPYAIYGRHVLRLDRLDPIDVDPGPRERGNAIHKALERFLTEYPGAMPADAFGTLCAIGEEEFAKAGASPAVMALWRPRFERAAEWFLHYEANQRASLSRAFVERKADLHIDVPGGAFVLRGRADRIDVSPEGLADIVDYKTGRVPTSKQINALYAPQLPLEAAMLMEGGFADVDARRVDQLIHVRLTGGDPPGELCVFEGDATAKATEALARLRVLISRYDDPATPYRSREIVEKTTFAGDYDHLARVGEWSLFGGEEE
jgi:ATP-dependent helicase/nuclease subunit B